MTITLSHSVRIMLASDSVLQHASLYNKNLSQMPQKTGIWCPQLHSPSTQEVVERAEREHKSLVGSNRGKN